MHRSKRPLCYGYDTSVSSTLQIALMTCQTPDPRARANCWAMHMEAGRTSSVSIADLTRAVKGMY